MGRKKMHIRTGKTYPKWLPLPCENLEVSDAIIFRKADPTLIADGVAALREALSDSGNIEIANRTVHISTRFSLIDDRPERAAWRDTGSTKTG